MSLQEYLEKHLGEMASADDNFKARYEDKDKSMKECLQYITEQAKKQAVDNCAAIADEDVLNWATHYYQEKDCKPKASIQAKVVASSSKPKAEVKQMNVAKPKPTAKKKEEKKSKAVELDLFGGF